MRFPLVLFVVFLILKLGAFDTVVESWSWWWVTSPLWIAALIGVVLTTITGSVLARIKKI